MKLILSICLSFLIAAPQMATAMPMGGVAASISMMGAGNNNRRPRPITPPRLDDKVLARGFVATSQAQCEARQSIIHVSSTLCTRALEIARQEHAETAPVYQRAEDCAAEHPTGTCEPRAAISEQRREVRVFQPAFTGALIFKTDDDRFGVNAVMAGHRGDAWTRPGFPGIAYLHEARDSWLPAWMVVNYGGLFGTSKPDTEDRMIQGQRTGKARKAGCPGYGYAMAANGHCPVDRILDTPSN